MLGKTRQVYFLAILLGAVLLGAQMHCCVELNSTTTNSHACPICSTVGTAITNPSMVMAMVPAIDRLEVFASVIFVSLEFSRATSPRAPPVL